LLWIGKFIRRRFIKYH